MNINTRWTLVHCGMKSVTLSVWNIQHSRIFDKWRFHIDDTLNVRLLVVIWWIIPLLVKKFLIFVKESFIIWIWRLPKYQQTPWEQHSWWTKSKGCNMTNLFQETNSKGERSGMRRRSSRGICLNLLTLRESVLLSNVRLRLLLMMVSKMQLLTKGLHVLWRVRVFTKEVYIFCNGDNSKKTACSHVHRSNNGDWKISLQSGCQSYRH